MSRKHCGVGGNKNLGSLTPHWFVIDPVGLAIQKISDSVFLHFWHPICNQIFSNFCGAGPMCDHFFWFYIPFDIIFLKIDVFKFSIKKTSHMWPCDIPYVGCFKGEDIPSVKSQKGICGHIIIFIKSLKPQILTWDFKS